MFYKMLTGASGRIGALIDQLPSQCAVCHAWPAQRVCDGCAARFAQPRTRCARCALPVPEGVSQCGACLREPPRVDACLAAVDYGYPWAGAMAEFKFRGDPGWASALATLRTEPLRIGLEREAWRIDAHGCPSAQLHPFAADRDGFAEGRITVDFAENQAELITAPMAGSAGALAQLRRLHARLYRAVPGELLWPLSTPGC